jgi:cation transport ATPase
MTNKGKVLIRTGITAIVLPFILTLLFGILPSKSPTGVTNINVLLYLLPVIIGIFLITLSFRYRVKDKENKPTIQKEKSETSKKQGKSDGTSSNSNTIIGLIIIFFALLFFFLFPLDSFIGIPQTAMGSLKQFGIQTSFTFYSLFSVCSNPVVPVFFPQCGLIMFISISIFIAIIIGLILLIKGLIKK